MNTKSILYHLLLSYSLKELIDGNIYHCKIDYKAIKKIANIKKDAVLDKYMKVTEAFTDEQMDKAWA